MLQNEIIIINTSMPLRNYMKRRPTHYAEILSRKNRVINLSSTSIRNKLKPSVKYPWEEKIFYRFPGEYFFIIQKVNKILFKIFVKNLIRKLDQRPIIWNFYSGNYDVISSIPNKICILEICDDTPEFFAHDIKSYKRIKNCEEKMIKNADIVFTVSENLKRKRSSIRSDIKVVRNGAVYEDFKIIPKLHPNPSDELYEFNHPIVGYFGAISRWLDYNLIEELADKLKSVHFIYIGRISKELKSKVEKLNNKNNIHFLGEKSYEEIPSYMKYFSLCHIPFKINELTASVNPIKLYEYLAAGKRVVSTPIPEVILFQKSGIVEVASGVKNYVFKIQGMLTKKSSDYMKSCQNIAILNTWESRVEKACYFIKLKLSKESNQKCNIVKDSILASIKKI